MSAHSLRSTAEALGAVLSGSAFPAPEPVLPEHITFVSAVDAIEAGMDAIRKQDGGAIFSVTGWNSDELLDAWFRLRLLRDHFEALSDDPPIPEPSPEERAVVESRLAAWDERHSAGIEDIDYPEVE